QAKTDNEGAEGITVSAAPALGDEGIDTKTGEPPSQWREELNRGRAGAK
ncbi:MAG: hypothetical protein K0Q94_5725, partial [Paenibacillus sp.]|nr:hypothetical protein [Paenibacillus sp.]